MKRDIPFDIPAGATEELECILNTPRAGAFSSQIHLYLDDVSLRELVLHVQGTAK